MTDQAYIDDRPTLPLTFHHEDGTVENIGTAIYNKDGTVDCELLPAEQVSEKFKRIVTRAMEFSASIEYHRGTPLRAKTVSIFVEDAQ